MNPNLRKGLFTVGILVLLLLLALPLIPLLQKIDIQPICFYGNWLHIKIIKCESSDEPEYLVSLPELDKPIPIIVDDDGSPDGMIALLYFLNNPMFDVRAITISYGEAHPEIFAPQVLNLLSELDRTDIPVGYGSDSPLEGKNAFPESWREASNRFWDIPLQEQTNTIKPLPAVDLIIETLRSSDSPITIFISGAHTNLAEVLREDPAIKEKIKDVYIMGGSIYTNGNIHSVYPAIDNEVAEWNIWVDPTAASEVFSSGLELHLVPLDATADVLWRRNDLTFMRNSGVHEVTVAYDIAQMMLTSNNLDSIYIWDLVTAVQATTREYCPEVPLSLRVVTEPGSEQGLTIVTDGAPNVFVCLNMDAKGIKAMVNTIFSLP